MTSGLLVEIDVASLLCQVDVRVVTLDLVHIASRRAVATMIAMAVPFALCAACSDSDETGPTATAQEGIADSSGLGPFEPLLGVGSVVDATVEALEGPTATLDELGGLEYAGRSESPDEWTTPLGLPVVVLADVAHVESVGGSERAESVDRMAKEAAAGDGSLEVLAPVGVFTVGTRYEFWLAPESDGGLMTYLAFDEDGKPVPGLGLPGAEDAFARASDVAAAGRIPALAQLASELNAASKGAADGPMMVELFGADSSASSVDADQVPATSDGPVDGVEYADVAVLVSGVTDGEAYSLAGSTTLGWFAAGNGLASIRGRVPQGESLRLIRRAEPGGGAVPVEGAPILRAPTESGVQWFLYEIDRDGTPTLDTDLAPEEVDAVIQVTVGIDP
ncbi:hypothetical protein BDK89_1485 [Ilumatobacter fluminis]|uniref:Uncharacterized protein n=2 Tax=Ilumatobacter fluminis TaxID=467091 RepID=A0A4R7HXV6_9ACTN|nr:hypothetical protein BDK89_1485 [Ilumatobacter fluminis]